MSYMAVYDITKALQQLLHARMRQEGHTTAVVTVLPPGEELPKTLGVNLYLYRVLESPFTKNEAWRGDRTTPPAAQPALGLQLYYLLTPLGAKPDASSLNGDDAHTMFGLALQTLHEHPVLNDVHIPGFDADLVLPPYLLNSYEQLKICLLPIGLDELSKIWGAINQPYRLSAAYELSLAELTPPPPPPVNGGIVMQTGVEVRTLDPAHLTSLTPAAGALARIAGGQVTPNDLKISGYGFLFPGESPVVRVGGRPATARAVPPPTDETLTVALPIDLDAGPQADVQITRGGRVSAPLVFTVTPWLSQIQPLRTALDPTLAADLSLMLFGSGFTNPQEVWLEGPGGVTHINTFGAGGSDSSATVTLPSALANGLYRVRLVLNDAANSASNSRTLEVIPRLDAVTAALVPPGSPPVGGDVHELTLDGARLAANDVRLLLDGVAYQVGANGDAAQLVYRLGRRLSAGPHSVAVVVDGQRSRPIELMIS